uniref:Fibrinogen gamma chain n=1 Tax=Callorhinchus milii TaxID=7868 RepID=K4FTB5_CALMI|nr:fibrinogen gamma polypeptide [Callorhinchus milii]|eukprot:gi/632982085/ref/XP_007907943.1/ PREDICTED: fibrinogen gamma chain [Callorhinchus milii]
MSGTRSKLLAFLQVLLLACSLTRSQFPPSKDTCCNLDSRFGEFCPTTCGVFNFLSKHRGTTDYQLSVLEKSLQAIENATTLTRRQMETIEQSNVVIKKQLPDTFIKRIRDIQTDIFRFERVSEDKNVELREIESILSSNREVISRLKRTTQELHARCGKTCRDTIEIFEVTGRDCQEIADKGARKSGLYYIKPDRTKQQFLVYCEIDSAGRGWTVLQRRLDGSVNFYKNWVQYKEGFGYLSPADRTEFWLGNEKMHLLTMQQHRPYLLKITLKDWSGEESYAFYNGFKVASEEEGYRLIYSFFDRGSAGNAFEGFAFKEDVSDKFYTRINGMKFSTADQDNDAYDGNCALQDTSGWWMNKCHAANLNGNYYQGGHYTADQTPSGFDNGIIWATWRDRWYSLKETTMKIIPIRRYSELQHLEQEQTQDMPRGDN